MRNVIVHIILLLGMCSVRVCLKKKNKNNYYYHISVMSRWRMTTAAIE